LCFSQFFNYSRFPGTQTEVINAGSYNYLGFAQSEGPCAEASANSISQLGLSTGGSAHEIGLPIFPVEFLVGISSQIQASAQFTANWSSWWPNSWEWRRQFVSAWDSPPIP
jgi:hypothetical protein